MKRVLLPLFACVLAAAAARAAGLVEGSVDRADPLSYAVGDAAAFTFRVAADADFGGADPAAQAWLWSVVGEGGAPAHGAAPFVPGAPLVVTNRFSAPGLMRATAFLAPVGEAQPPVPAFAAFAAACVAGAALADLPCEPEPEDFDAFWAAALAEIEPEKLPSGPGFLFSAPEADAARAPGLRVSAFVVPLGPGRAPATGWVSWPAQAPIRGCPMVVRFAEYGMGPDAFPADAPRDALFVLVQPHGFVPGMPRAERIAAFNAMSNGGRGGAYGFRPGENEDPAASVFRGIVLRDLAALRFARTLPVWDRVSTTLQGHGQGAWEALACAALAPDDTLRLRLASPWLCGLGRDVSRAPRFVPALRYFDGVNFARRVRAPVEIEARFFDATFAPTAALRLRNALPAAADLRWADAP